MLGLYDLLVQVGHLFSVRHGPLDLNRIRGRKNKKTDVKKASNDSLTVQSDEQKSGPSGDSDTCNGKVILLNKDKNSHALTCCAASPLRQILGCPDLDQPQQSILPRSRPCLLCDNYNCLMSCLASFPLSGLPRP